MATSQTGDERVDIRKRRSTTVTITPHKDMGGAAALLRLHVEASLFGDIRSILLGLKVYQLQSLISYKSGI